MQISCKNIELVSRDKKH